MRTIPAELVRRYEEEGWWTPETLGDLLARGLADSPGHRLRRALGGAAVRGARSATSSTSPGGWPQGCRPRRRARRRRGAYSCRTGWRPPSRSGRRRSSGAVVVPIVHFYGRKELAPHPGDRQRRGSSSPPSEFGRMTLPARPVRRRADRRPGRRCGLGERQRVRASTTLLADEPLPGTRRDRPGEPGADRVHLGHHPRPQGGRSTATRRWASRRASCWQNYPADRGRQLTATPVGHFIGMVGAFLIPVLEGAPIDLCDVWDPGRVLALMDARGPLDRRRAAVLRHQPARPSRLHRRAPALIHHRRPRRLDGARGGHPPADRPRACSCSAPTAAPSTRRSPGRARARRRTSGCFTDGDARPGVEIRLADDGEIFSRGPGSVPGLHRRRPDGEARSTTTAGTTPATSACSTTTAT